MDRFDLIVLGGGPAGYLGAERAARGGLSVAVFEKKALGGVCLNEGCIPSKALLNSARICDSARSGAKYGVNVAGAEIDHAAVVARKNKVVKTLVSGVSMKLKKENVTVVEQAAVIAGRDAEGFTVLAGGDTYRADKLLIAAGSIPIIPEIPGLVRGLESGFCLTNREVLDLEKAPASLVVIGGGIVGLEMASYFNSAGAKVTVIEMMDKIAGPAEREISEILMKNLKKSGINFKLSCQVTAVGDGEITYEEKGEAKALTCEKVLLSVGRKPVIDGIGLDSIGVYTENGAVVTDGQMRTNIPGVYAAGDVNGKSMLAHTAYREAEVAVNHMLGKKDVMRYDAIPSVIYTNPEAAWVGETPESAAEKGIAAKTVSISMRMSGRYLAETEGGNGIAKLVADEKNNCLIGVHLVGSYASEMIYGAALMLETKLNVEALKELVFPHPTVSEVIREALFEV
ncbi:MAG: dihydrolipoyl dehydrogenase [Oscillospiraceae bacterium]|nr:dihydrolipoyl dehydrogenase [Oscillospiraceae bacterium]